MTLLRKWDVLHVSPPGIGHGKYATCICPMNLLFFYINSEPAFGRKRRSACVEVAPFQALFLRKLVSYLDTSDLVHISQDVVQAALTIESNHKGPLLPSLREQVRNVVAACGVLEPGQIRLVLNDPG